MCNVCAMQGGRTSNTTLQGCVEEETGLAACCVQALFDAASADPTFTGLQLHLSVFKVGHSGVYDMLASRPYEDVPKWIQIDVSEGAAGISNSTAPTCAKL
jgi:hypothetical protein